MIELAVPLLIVGFVLMLTMIIASSSGASNLQVSQLTRLATNGIPARGLVLRASTYTTKMRAAGTPYELRDLTLDVEIEGRDPYVIAATPLIPRGVVMALPGTALDLMIDPKDANNILVLGPGGFSGPWLQNASGGPLIRPPMSRFATVTLLVLGIGMFMAGLMIVVDHDHKPKEKVPAGGWCQAATRCCKQLAAREAKDALMEAKAKGGKKAKPPAIPEAVCSYQGSAAACKKQFEDIQYDARVKGLSCK